MTLISKNKLPLFSHPMKQKIQLVSLKIDCNLFSRQYISCRSRDDDLDAFLTRHAPIVGRLFPEIVLRKVCVCVCVCMYVYYLFVFPHPREQTFYLKLESSLYANNKG